MKRKKRLNSVSAKNHTPPREETNLLKLKTIKKNRKLRTARNIYWGIFLIVLLSGGGLLLYISQDLPPLTQLEQIDPALATQVYSDDGEIIASFYRINRTYTPFNKFPDYLVKSLIAIEDRRFYDHWAVNIYGALRAMLVNLRHLRIKEGSSTLTMQLSKNLYFGLERTWTRKIKEIMTAIQIERTYSKNEIIEMYLNVNFFGSNAYGIKAAAKRFFSKEVEELTIEECALLIGVLQAQTKHNPINNPESALQRRNIVLKSMLDVGYLSKTVYDSLTQIPVNLNLSAEEEKISPYFTEYVRQQLNQLQDSLNINIYEDGLRVYTTLNTQIQKYMIQAIDSTMPSFQRLVRSQKIFQELKKDTLDSVFLEMSTVQIAFVCIDPHTGHILGMVGGRDFEKYKFNRAVQAPRQPGSAFKPFVYTTAIDNGYSPADEFLNQPFVLINDDGTRWTPHNYDYSVSGLMSLREGLYRSKNLISIRLIQEIGPSLVAQYAKRMGISTRIRPVPSLALGTSEVYPLELVSSYGIFANGGIHVKPISIIKIEDKTGNVIYQHRPERRVALSQETTCIMNDILQDVIRRGTGYAIRRDYNFYIPAGGKTGTTNDNTDAWFVGFTPNLVAGVWVGFDDPKLTLGNNMTGARAALPFWGKFMKTVYDSLNFPKSEFEFSADVEKIKVCKDTKKLATPYCPTIVEELYNKKYIPSETCDVHTGKETIQKTKKRSF